MSSYVIGWNVLQPIEANIPKCQTILEMLWKIKKASLYGWAFG
jgi:hypothetical protein